MTAEKNQTIENLMAAIGAVPEHGIAVAAWTGERCWTTDGEPIVLWTYAEIVELATMYLNGDESPADPRAELVEAAKEWRASTPENALDTMARFIAAIEALG